MKKSILFFLLSITTLFAFSQRGKLPLRADSVVIEKVGGNAELTIRNSTRDSLGGFGLNVGSGRLEYHTPHRINDSTIQIGPITIIVGSGTSSGDTIYVAAAVDTFYTTPIGTGSPMIQTQWTVSGPNFSNIRHSRWGPGIFTIPRLASDSLARVDVDTAALRFWLTSALVSNAFPGLDDVLQVNQKLQANRSSDFQTFTWTMTGAKTSGNTVLEVDNTSSGNALTVNASGAGAGLVALSTSGRAGDFIITPSSTNTSALVANFFRSTSGTAANNMAGYLNFQLKDASNNIQDAVREEWSWIVAASGTRTAQYKLRGVTNAGAMADWITINDGSVTAFPTVGFGFSSQSGGGGGDFRGTTTGVYASASDNSGTGLIVNHFSTTTNNIVRLIAIQRQATYNGAVGLGERIEYYLNNSSGSNIISGHIDHVWAGVSLGNEISDLRFGVMTGTLSPGTVVNALIVKGKQATINLQFMPTYASNAAAVSGGLDVGDFYYNGDDVKRVH